MSQHLGSSPIDTAKKCFADNLQRFGNAQTASEKYNLYNGLANLAICIEQIQNEIERLSQLISARNSER